MATGCPIFHAPLPVRLVLFCISWFALLPSLMALFSSLPFLSSSLSQHTNTHFHMNSIRPTCKTDLRSFNSSPNPPPLFNASSSYSPAAYIYSYGGPVITINPTTYRRRRCTSFAIRVCWLLMLNQFFHGFKPFVVASKLGFFL